MMERFTRLARAVVTRAALSAREDGQTSTEPPDLFAAVLGEPQGLAVEVLADLGAPAGEVRQVLRGLRGEREQPGGLGEEDAEALKVLGIDLADVVRRIDEDLGGVTLPGGRPRFSGPAKKSLELALREAVGLGDGFIGTEHLLLGVVASEDPVVLGTLEAFDLTLADLRAAVERAQRRTG